MIIEISFWKNNKSDKQQCYRHTFDKLELENFVLPKYKPLSRDDIVKVLEYQQKMEQQKRFIDMISTKIAHEMTHYMINEYWKENYELKPQLNIIGEIK